MMAPIYYIVRYMIIHRVYMYIHRVYIYVYQYSYYIVTAKTKTDYNP
jgi:hypothetical protein